VVEKFNHHIVGFACLFGLVWFVSTNKRVRDEVKKEMVGAEFIEVCL